MSARSYGLHISIRDRTHTIAHDRMSRRAHHWCHDRGSAMCTHACDRVSRVA